ncbi:hypothetical protein Cantr_03413 [Candida viswanathii]|uniref:Uncharacterized protein n=1 Tax=Candida viswanathii TaxID=5486 RepID=A0A367YP59_9ASCO|nr:hypothetical protein Cantr_03413 [Candida viswanathii]
MVTSVLLLWISFLSILVVSSPSNPKPKPVVPETDVNDLVYFNQVFDMVIQQTNQHPPTLDNSTIPHVTIDKPKKNNTSPVDAQGKLKPKWEFNMGVYFEKKVNKKLLKKMMKDGKFAAMADDDTGLVIGTTEKVLIPTELMVSRAIPDTHNLFHQNLTTYPKKKTKIKVHNIKMPKMSPPQPPTSTYLYYDYYGGSSVDDSSGNKLVHSLWDFFWWILLYVL